MQPHRRDHIQRSLRSLADAYAATMRLMEQTLQLLYEEAALDPLTYMQAQFVSEATHSGHRLVVVDPQRFLVTFQGQDCFLGNTHSFRFFSRLARRPNHYVKYEELLNDVWDGKRSDTTVRSAAKVLRQRLRQAGLVQLAEAIDGRVSGHYALKLP